MPNFGKLSLTSTGVNTLVKAQAGSEIAFSKIKMGSGIYSGDVTTLTDIIETKLSAEIVKGTLLNNTYTVEAHFTNENLEQGFYWREIGLYVLDANGNDILFGYANAGSSSDYVPATTSEIYTKHIRIAVAVGDAQDITVNHSSGTYVDVVTFDEAMSEKVDKEEGKGLSSNDYTDEDKQKLLSYGSRLEEATSSLNQSIANIQNSLSSYATKAEVEGALTGLSEDINSFKTEINELIESTLQDISDINDKVGFGDLSDLGDGSIIDAILTLYSMVNKIPAITSGTSAPVGGKDGDVYIMHE